MLNPVIEALYSTDINRSDIRRAVTALKDFLIENQDTVTGKTQNGPTKCLEELVHFAKAMQSASSYHAKVCWAIFLYFILSLTWMYIVMFGLLRQLHYIPLIFLS